jgi:UDP-2,3-diacylglucosamine pyrophosphatase LpxH
MVTGHKYKTIIVSDIHLGTSQSMAKELNTFLDNIECERLILNGDIIDGWRLKRKMTWKHKHTKFFINVLKIIKKTEVIYIRGNHDDFLDDLIPFDFEKLQIKSDYKFTALNGITYYVCHGDRFDHITTNIKALSVFGDILYNLITKTNNPYNYFRRLFGLKYLSLSYLAKDMFKKAYLDKSDYYSKIEKFARKNDCGGIILGHTHIPDDKFINEIHYLNSGDFIESGTLLVEDFSGEWSILKFNDKSHGKINIGISNE